MPNIRHEEICRRVAEELAGQMLQIKSMGGGEVIGKVRVMGWGCHGDLAIIVVEDPDSLCSTFDLAKPHTLTSRPDPFPKRLGLLSHHYLKGYLTDKPKVDAKRFPHKCGLCKSPAYFGFNQVECSTAGCRGAP